jgi:hypothetical protein
VVVQLKREKLAAELNQRNLQNHTVRSHERTHDLSLEEVHQAYDRVRGRQLGSAVFISDLASELQIGLPKLQEWIHSEVIKSGHGSLDEGHWPTATEGQRAAAIEHLGSRCLLIRFSQPDRAALIKEYDGQVKTPRCAGSARASSLSLTVFLFITKVCVKSFPTPDGLF